MQSRFFPAIGAIALLFSFVIYGCTKLDTTALGTDLIPPVDNINTFKTELAVNTTQGFFADTTKVTREELQALGHIESDNVFGKTTANMFFQLKPTFYPYQFGNTTDTLQALDSVVLCLSYNGTWGDTMVPQQLQVREVLDNSFRDDARTSRPVTYAPALGAMLGSATISIAQIQSKRYISRGRDSVTNQIRIPLTNAAYNNVLYTSTTLDRFKNDSNFRATYNGIAVLASNSMGNGLMYINLNDVKTRLEIHYKKRTNNVLDTTYSSLRLAPSAGALFPSSTANNVIRNYSGFPVATANTQVNYLQTAPGTFINVDVPGLNTFKDTNRIVHRAILTMEQVPSGNALNDSLFSPPQYVYLDLKDTGVAKWKPIYLDLNPNQTYDPDFKFSSFFFPVSVDQNYYGGGLKYKTIGGTRKAFYEINVTRYLQRMLIKNGINYTMRLSAPFSIIYPQYAALDFPYSNQIALGRIQVGSGANSNYQMKLVVIWSKVN